MSSESKTGKTTIEVNMPYIEVTCDGGCGASYRHRDRTYQQTQYDMPAFPPPPSHWLILGHQDGYGKETWDFCSHRCIAVWAEKQVAVSA